MQNVVLKKTYIHSHFTMEFYDVVTDMSEQFREQVEGIIRNVLSAAGK